MARLSPRLRRKMSIKKNRMHIKEEPVIKIPDIPESEKPKPAKKKKRYKLKPKLKKD